MFFLLRGVRVLFLLRKLCDFNVFVSFGFVRRGLRISVLEWSFLRRRCLFFFGLILSIFGVRVWKRVMGLR